MESDACIQVFINRKKKGAKGWELKWSRSSNSIRGGHVGWWGHQSELAILSNKEKSVCVCVCVFNDIIQLWVG